MKDNLTELAKLFKERDNKTILSITTGKIVTLSPLVIRLNEIVLLDSTHLILSERIHDMLQYGGLKPNDKVILIPDSNGQLYFAIDRVVP